MPSIHVWKSIEKAADNGGYAGSESALPLWDMSKRELVEIAIRLGALVADDDSPEAGAKTALGEYSALKSNGIV